MFSLLSVHVVGDFNVFIYPFDIGIRESTLSIEKYVQNNNFLFSQKK